MADRTGHGGADEPVGAEPSDGSVPGPADGSAVGPAGASPVRPAGASAPDAGPDGLGDDSLLAGFTPEPTGRRWSRVLLTVVGVLIVVVGGYVAAAWLLADRVPRETTVAGIDIGGLTAGAAAAALESGLAEAGREPVPVAADGGTASLDPVEAGLALDSEATVARLTGLDLHPVALWEHVVGGGPQPPVSEVDEDALGEALDAVAGMLTTEPVDAGVVFADGAPHVTDAAAGSRVDMDAAAELVRDGWLTASEPLRLPTAPAEPDITQEEAETALRTVAEPFAAAPIAVAVGDRTVELPVEVLTSLATFTVVDSELSLTLEGERLVEEVLARADGLLTAAVDARFEFVDGAPVVVPGTPGTSLDPAALAEAVIAAGTGQDRTARVELTSTEPRQTTESLEALGITEVVSEFSTPHTDEPLRTQNLRVGAAKINGTLVRPGETFSLTEALGPITAEAGFRNATVIVDGEHVPGMGGGLSQISTTTYNAAFFAGFEDVEHQPHSEWFARYPEGREATLYSGVIDMKFKNTTPYGALIQAWVADGRVHVRIWGTKHWTVETSTSPRSDVVQPTTVRSSSPTCTPQRAGNPGFTVTVTRRLLLDGVEQETTSDRWRYNPQNAVVCEPEG